jgi:tight adherence protein B
MALLLSILTFLLVTVILGVIWLSLGSDPQQEVVRRRMESVRKAERRGNVSLSVELVRDEMLSGVPFFNRLLMKWSWSTRFRDFVVQAGLKTRPTKILLIGSIMAVGGYFVTGFFLPRFPLPYIAAAIGMVVPFVYVGFLRSRRLGRFEEHFPEALDLLGRAVRAGHAFTTGLEMIAKEAPEPISGEFRTSFEEQNFGLPLRDALLNLTERVPLVDVRFFVTALLIQKETGGNLAEILDGLSRVIRERFRIHREVQTRTAQGKLTAAILIAIPPFMMVALGALNPQYMNTLYNDRLGPTILAVAGTLQVVGSALLWKIIHIEV